MRNHSAWFYFRLVNLLLAMATAPILYKQMHTEFQNSDFSWSIVLWIFGFGALGIPLVLALQYVNPLTDERWLRPSWEENPWNYRQPILSMHMAAWVFMVIGGSVALYTMFIGSNNLLWVFFFTLGVGVFAGVKLTVAMFSDKFQRK